MGKNRTHIGSETLTENATRHKLLSDCIRRFGPEGGRQLKLLFAKWDKLMASCKNESELKHMRRLACAEIFSALGYRGGLQVGDDTIIPAEDTGPKLISSA